MTEPLLHETSILVVDANMILAFDVEDTLMRWGAARVDIVGTTEEALLVLRSARYHAALVDLNLPDRGALPVAAALAQLGIPFAFSAGHGERAALPASYASAQLLHLPSNEGYLVGAVAKLLKHAQ